jgi:hypothetical protein
MNAPSPVPLPARHRTWPARLIQLGTVLVVTAIAAATFVLSYAGVHAIALQSGVPAELARFYPAVFDAVLVIACAAAPLRARWWTRCYTWLVITMVVGFLGAMDAVHAMNVTIPRRQAAGVAAVLPWILLLLAFGLWLAILRHFRAERPTEDAPPAGPAQPVTYATAGGSPLDDPAPDGPAGDMAYPADLSDKLFGPRSDSDPADKEPGDSAPLPEKGAAGIPVPEVPGIPYATGPRLRRVRSLPAPPVDDGGD